MSKDCMICSFFFLNDRAPPEISPLPLHAALPISRPYLSAAVSPPSTEFPPRRRWLRFRTRGAVALARRAGSAAGTRGTSSTPRTPTHFGSERSEEHTSELQSRSDLVCRLLLEKKK